jgi:hypothetical protein
MTDPDTVDRLRLAVAREALLLARAVAEAAAGIDRRDRLRAMLVILSRMRATLIKPPAVSSSRPSEGRPMTGVPAAAWRWWRGRQAGR